MGTWRTTQTCPRLHSLDCDAVLGALGERDEQADRRRVLLGLDVRLGAHGAALAKLVHVAEGHQVERLHQRAIGGSTTSRETFTPFPIGTLNQLTSRSVKNHIAELVAAQNLVDLNARYEHATVTTPVSPSGAPGGTATTSVLGSVLRGWFPGSR